MEPREDFIKRLCLQSGYFEGPKMKIIPLKGMEELKWVIIHSDCFGTSSEYYEDIDEAVYDFMALEGSL